MTLRALLTPVFIAVAISITAFAVLMIFAASEQDNLSAKSQRAVLAQQMAALSSNLEVLAVDNAWWEMAVEKIAINLDKDWIRRTVGSNIINIGYLDGVLIVRQDHTVLYSMQSEQGPNKALPVQTLLSTSIGDTLRNLAVGQDGQKSATHGLMVVDGTLLAYGISLVHNDDDTNINHMHHTHPAMIFYSILTPEEVEIIGNKVAVDNLHLTDEEARVAYGLMLKDENGAPVGQLAWNTRDPGTEMALDMVVPSVILLLLVVGAMLRFVNRATALVDGIEQANRSKSTFLASMSHEVRTPLNSILGFSELMSLELFGNIEGEKNKEYLRLIRSSGDHLLAIINDILDISKLEAGKFDVYAEEIHPEHIITECIRMMEPSAKDRSISITQDCEVGTILSDERIVRQILINILSNAVKFTKQGGDIHVSGKYTDSHYQILVADNGIGMSQSEIEIALMTFGQIKNQQTNIQAGTGLGLPLVQRFITLLDGTMHISSNPGKGTSVTLNFPLKTTAKKL